MMTRKAPNTKQQTSNKSNYPNSKHQIKLFGSFEIGIYLDIGIWKLEF